MYSSDEKLVSQTLAGDRDAFGVLVRKYQGVVYTYAFQRVRNEADSQDISQEVFLRAYRHLYQLRHPHRFRSWLYTIMANECNRWLKRVSKKRQREIALEDAADDALQVEPAHTVPTPGWEIDLEQAISALSDDNRVAVAMFYMGECSLKEISEFLGVSANTVKGKLYRARQQLGSAMSVRYGRYLKSHTLKGGFLMQLTEQIRRIPTPAMAFTWSSTTVSKTLFSLITALCVLIGLIGGRIHTSTELSGNQLWPTRSDATRWPIEAAFYTPDQYAASTSVSGIPTPSGKHPLSVSNRAPTRQGSQSIDKKSVSSNRGAKNDLVRLPATAAGNEGENLIYSGRVVDSDGAPVADAEVFYSIRLDPSKSVARTGADGTFRFKFPRPSVKERDKVSIVAKHPKYAIGWQNCPLQSKLDIEIQLGTPGVISGRILNSAGDPILDAEARIQYLFSGYPTSGMPEGDLGMDVYPIQPAVTDTNGEFVLRGLPQGTTINLQILGPGYAEERQYSVPVGAKELEFRLKREARIEGRLSYAETGAPVISATVGLLRIDLPGPEVLGRASVDANGNFLLHNIPHGMYNLFLDEGPEGWTAVAKVNIQVDEGQTVSNVDLSLVRGGFITARVNDRDTNEPIANSYVSFIPSGALGDGGRTDENGIYRFYAAPGRVLVSISAPSGYLDIGRIRRHVEVVEAETVAVDFQFSKGIDLIVRAVAATGKPVSGARISDISDKREWDEEYGKSSEIGEFTVRGLLPEQKLTLKAEHSGINLRGTAKVEVQLGASVEIRMERYERVTVSGRVVSRAGKPITTANIELMRWYREIHMGRSSTAAVTDGDGRFREIGLIIGDEYGIRANAKGYVGAETGIFTATAEMTQIPDLVLSPAATDTYFIEGRVTDTSGDPVHGARLVTSLESQHSETQTDENGDYRLENLPTVVILELRIFHSEYAYHEFRNLKTDQRHDLVLVKADGHLAGKVVDAQGKPIERAFVTVEAEKDSSGYIYSGVDTNLLGEFELKYIKDSVVSVYATNGTDYKIFEGINVNQRDLVLTLAPNKPRPEPTPEHRARWNAHVSYMESLDERFETLFGKTAPELAVAEWLSGSPAAIGDLKGKIIVLHSWDLSYVDDHVHWIRLLNMLQDAYGEKGLVCIAVCPASEEVQTVKRHIVEQSLSYSVGLDRPTEVVGAKGETFDRYAFGQYSFILIDAAGEVAGRAWAEDLEIQIHTLLAE
ncbi:MAG: sigma-70 family RNA polymerase sigma factor [Candidatus Poribacteria bacterium]|nr:sigma-70 family RNA polymerase sigma factor [Candidatus Poribacteria bacterium]